MKKPGRPSFRPRINTGRGSSKPRENPRKEWYGDNWEATSNYVRQRDGYRCRINVIQPSWRCGVYLPPPFHSMLHAHHIVPLPRGSNHPTNLISLCRECHGKIHGKNLGRITDKQKSAARQKRTR